MRILVVAVLMSASVVAMADDFDLEPLVTNEDFRAIAEDLSGTLNYKALGPVDAGGITGFSIGAYVTYSETEHPDAWRRVTLGDVDEIGLVGLRVTKGLPFDIDVGVSYSEVPGTDAKFTGAEVRYALMPGSTVTPALALRATYSTLTGVDEFDYETTSIDLSLSKGFVIAAPYVGIGRNESRMTPKGSLAATSPNLREEKVSETRVFAGLRLTLFPLLSLTPEFEKVGEVTSYNLRVGVSF